MGKIANFFGLGKEEETVNEMAIPQTQIGGRKGHSGQFQKAIRKRRVRNRIARLSRRRNRKSRFKRHKY